LLAAHDTLVLLRGQWVEIDRDPPPARDGAISRSQDLAEREGLTFAEAMRLLAAAPVATNGADRVDDRLVAGGGRSLGWPRLE